MVYRNDVCFWILCCRGSTLAVVRPVIVDFDSLSSDFDGVVFPVEISPRVSAFASFVAALVLQYRDDGVFIVTFFTGYVSVATDVVFEAGDNNNITKK